MSDSVRPYRWQPNRLPHPWDSPGKNTEVGCHFLLQCRKVKSESEVIQSCLSLSDPMDCSPQGSSIHGIFQTRVLEWVAIAFSRKTVWKFLNKTRNKTTMWPKNSTARHIPWGKQNWRRHMYPIASLFTVPRTWKQPRCPSKDEWIKKLWCIYTMEYHSVIKMNTFESVLMRWINLEPTVQIEVSQKEKDKNHILRHIYRI